METIEDRALLVTLDTSVLDEHFEELERAANALSSRVDFVTVTAADRERGEHESRPTLPTIYEAVVVGESRLGMAVLGSDESAALFETIKRIISDGSLKPPPDGAPLNDGEARQVRDAMNLEAHVRKRRDIFVTLDTRGFINHGKREQLEALCSTRIMTPEDFVDWCSQRNGE